MKRSDKCWKIVVGVYILACTLSSCTPHITYLRNEGRQLVELPRTDRLLAARENPTKCCITHLEELKTIKADPLTYAGTLDNYQIIQWWIKFVPGPNACMCFAVPKNEYQPDYPFAYAPGEWSKHPRSHLFKDLVPDTPTGLQWRHRLLWDELSWQPVPRAGGYRVEYRCPRGTAAKRSSEFKLELSNPPARFLLADPARTAGCDFTVYAVGDRENSAPSPPFHYDPNSR